jgi:hypothetical protein
VSPRRFLGFNRAPAGEQLPPLGWVWLTPQRLAFGRGRGNLQGLAKLPRGEIRELPDHAGNKLALGDAGAALTNGRSKVEERVARWLLMAHDRVEGDELTHEFLSMMLGVRRAGVSTALSTLGDRRLIQSGRRMIRIVDREGLKKASNGAYGPAEFELEKLFGSKP